jgi:hypothetical protein
MRPSGVCEDSVSTLAASQKKRSESVVPMASSRRKAPRLPANCIGRRHGTDPLHVKIVHAGFHAIAKHAESFPDAGIFANIDGLFVIDSLVLLNSGVGEKMMSPKGHSKITIPPIN